MTPEGKTDIAILVTLWIEFFYDLFWNSREARLKRHTKKKQKPLFEQLTQGEGK